MSASAGCHTCSDLSSPSAPACYRLAIRAAHEPGDGIPIFMLCEGRGRSFAVEPVQAHHWPSPLLAGEVDPDRGPALVTVEYTVAASDREAFLAAMAKLAGERRRDGAYDFSNKTPSCAAASWLEHMRQRHRMTNADRVLQDAVRRFHAGSEPGLRHLVAAKRSHKS